MNVAVGIDAVAVAAAVAGDTASGVDADGRIAAADDVASAVAADAAHYVVAACGTDAVD